MSKKLHILFLSSWYPSRVLPMNGNFVQRHAEAVATIHKVTVVHVITDKKLKKTFKLFEFNKNNVDTKIIYLSHSKNPTIKFIRFLKTYITTINEIGYFDIVHLNVTFPVGIIALYLKWFKKKPFIISEHWTGYKYPLNKSITKATKIITKIIIKNASVVCPVSKSLQNEMIYFGLKGKYKIIGNVVNTKLFCPINKKSDVFTIVHISSFVNYQKNISGILNVIKKLSEIRSDFIFKIIGDGDISKIQIKVNTLKIPKKAIQIEGVKTPSEIAKILQNVNLYISFSNYETFGIVMVEALACGVPVISTKTGILNEMNMSNFVNLIPISDEEALLENIIEYMNYDKLFDKKQMHRIIEKYFSTKNIANEFSSLYCKILSN